MSFDWSAIIQAMPELMKGVRLTLFIAITGILGGLALGMAVGLMRAYGNMAVNAIAFVYVELIRGTPLIVQVMFIYFALPEQGNPGFLIVLGAFLLSFSAGLLSQVPGGVGVMEAVFLAVMPGVPAPAVFAALLIWRLFYLILPLVISLPIVIAFERAQLKRSTRIAPPP